MRVVILGTGTDVGKTYTTACLARGLSERGAQSIVALKPVESGVEPSVAGDAGTIAAAAGHAPVLSGWRFRAAVAPHLAASKEGMSLDLTEIANWVRLEEQRAGARISLVELAGGAFSPLGIAASNVDLALLLEPAVWLLVAPDALGVLHDLSAALRALPRAPDAVLLSAARAPDQSSGTNAAELAKLGIAEVLEVIEAGQQSSKSAAEWLLRHPTYTSTQK